MGDFEYELILLLYMKHFKKCESKEPEWLKFKQILESVLRTSDGNSK